MADLVTHVCVALLPGAWFPTRALAPVVVGTVLPDVLGRVVPLALEQVVGLGVPLPEPLLWVWGALHEPMGWLLACALLSRAFVQSDRGIALWGLWLGCALHTGLDVLQFHHGEGYLLLAPMSTQQFELGWIGSEATVPVALPLLAATAIAWLPRWVEARGEVPQIGWRGLLAVSVPIHLLLPAVGATLLPTAGPEGLVGLWLWLHGTFVGFLVSSRRWWAGRWAGVALVVGVNHLATAVGLWLVT